MSTFASTTQAKKVERYTKLVSQIFGRTAHTAFHVREDDPVIFTSALSSLTLRT
jgi:hypothetical protein